MPACPSPARPGVRSRADPAAVGDRRGRPARRPRSRRRGRARRSPPAAPCRRAAARAPVRARRSASSSAPATASSRSAVWRWVSTSRSCAASASARWDVCSARASAAARACSASRPLECRFGSVALGDSGALGPLRDRLGGVRARECPLALTFRGGLRVPCGAGVALGALALLVRSPRAGAGLVALGERVVRRGLGALARRLGVAQLLVGVCRPGACGLSGVRPRYARNPQQPSGIWLQVRGLGTSGTEFGAKTGLGRWRGRMASIASARVGREQQLPEDAVEEIEEPEPEAPPRLRAAGEDVLRRGQEVRSSSLESDVGDGCCESFTRSGGSTTSARSMLAACSEMTASPETSGSAKTWSSPRAALSAGALTSSRRPPGSRSSSRRCCAPRSRITKAARRSRRAPFGADDGARDETAPPPATRRSQPEAGCRDDVEIDLRFAAGDLAKAAFELPTAAGPPRPPTPPCMSPPSCWPAAGGSRTPSATRAGQSASASPVGE